MQKFLEANVLSFEDKQLKEYELICNQYKKTGIKFNQNKIQFDLKKESSRASFASEIKNYSENYRFFLNESSLNTNSGFTRNEIYNPKSPLYVNQSSLFPSLENVIHAIHQAGGLAFLAHTFAYSPNISTHLIDIISNYALNPG